jgi:hypothetical protein
MIGKLLMGAAFWAASFNVFGQDARSVGVVKITGADETSDLAIEDIDGKGHILTKDRPSSGIDPHGTTWFYIGDQYDADGVGGLGDTVRVQIPAAQTPLDALYPAVDVTTTVTNAMITDDNPERALATQICDDLNGDTDFSNAKWSCQVIKDYSAVFISSTLFNEFGTRTAWTLTATGTTVVEQVHPEITNRQLESELARSPNDPRKGTLAISGTILAVSSGVGSIVTDFFKESGGSNDMRVDGDPTPVNFEIPCSNTKDIYVEEVRIFGGCNGIQFDDFLCYNTALSNGIEVSMLSKQESLVFPLIKRTEDFKNYFAFGVAGPGSNFRVDLQSGADQFIAEFQFKNAGVIQKCGTDLSGDDYFRIKIQDDLSSGLKQLEAMALGFTRDPL